MSKKNNPNITIGYGSPFKDIVQDRLKWTDEEKKCFELYNELPGGKEPEKIILGPGIREQLDNNHMHIFYPPSMEELNKALNKLSNGNNTSTTSNG